jgi:hypothetical protein
VCQKMHLLRSADALSPSPEERGAGAGGAAGAGRRRLLDAEYDVGQRSKTCDQHDWGTALAFKKFKGQHHMVDQEELERKLFYNKEDSVHVQALAAAVNPLLDKRVELCFGYPVREPPGLDGVDPDVVMARSAVHARALAQGIAGSNSAREGGQQRVGV